MAAEAGAWWRVGVLVLAWWTASTALVMLNNHVVVGLAFPHVLVLSVLGPVGTWSSIEVAHALWRWRNQTAPAVHPASHHPADVDEAGGGEDTALKFKSSDHEGAAKGCEDGGGNGEDDDEGGGDYGGGDSAPSATRLASAAASTTTTTTTTEPAWLAGERYGSIMMRTGSFASNFFFGQHRTQSGADDTPSEDGNNSRLAARVDDDDEAAAGPMNAAEKGTSVLGRGHSGSPVLKPTAHGMAAWRRRMRRALRKKSRQLPHSAAERGGQQQQHSIAAKKVVPIAFLTALSLTLGQLEYRYLSVSFISMLKALLPLFTLMFSVALALESCGLKLCAAVSVIVVGTLLTSWGEVNFDPFGVMLVLIDLASTALGMCLQQVLLEGCGTVDVMRATSPFIVGFLSFGVFLFDGRAGIAHASALMAATPLPFVGCAMLGVCVLWTSTAVIKHTSALWRMVLNQCKSLIVVMASILINGDKVSGLQGLGWLICAAGICWYSVLKSGGARSGASRGGA